MVSRSSAVRATYGEQPLDEHVETVDEGGVPSLAEHCCMVVEQFVEELAPALGGADPVVDIAPHHQSRQMPNIGGCEVVGVRKSTKELGERIERRSMRCSGSANLTECKREHNGRDDTRRVHAQRRAGVRARRPSAPARRAARGARRHVGQGRLLAVGAVRLLHRARRRQGDRQLHAVARQGRRQGRHDARRSRRRRA